MFLFPPKKLLVSVVVLPASLLPPQPSLVSSPGLAWRGGADCLPAGGCVREQPRPDSMLCFRSNSAAGATTTSSISIYLDGTLLASVPFKRDEEDIDRDAWIAERNGHLG